MRDSRRFVLSLGSGSIDVTVPRRFTEADYADFRFFLDLIRRSTDRCVDHEAPGADDPMCGESEMVGLP